MKPEETKKKEKHILFIEIGITLIAVALVIFFTFHGGGAGNVTFTRDQASPSVINTPTSTPAKEVPMEIVVVTNTGAVQGSAKENIATANPNIFKAPENFKSFAYDASKGKVISLSGTCRDSYYAILVFESSVDYRKSPASARYNSAFSCPASHLFTTEVNIKDFNLPTGNYYIFVADQGDKGSWYNPR